MAADQMLVLFGALTDWLAGWQAGWLTPGSTSAKSTRARERVGRN